MRDPLREHERRPHVSQLPHAMTERVVDARVASQNQLAEQQQAEQPAQKQASPPQDRAYAERAKRCVY